MKIVYPDYFTAFKCAAGECKDTCCAGWEIVVDQKSAARYGSVEGAFGEKLKNMMTEDSDGDIIFSPQNGRCPFLNRENLCDIYINCGEDYLCTTCKMFPRFVEEFGSIRETGLGLGCPEAVRIILSQQNPWNFACEFSSEAPLPNNIDPELYFALVKMRKKLFEIIFNKDISFTCAVGNILAFADKCQLLIDDELFDEVLPFCDDFIIDADAKADAFGEQCREILSGLEVLNPEWREILSKTDFDGGFEYTDDFRNIAAYYIYRYFLKAAYDYDAITKVRLCAFSCEVIARVRNAGISLEDAVRLYSKEAEYSAENLEILYDLL